MFRLFKRESPIEKLQKEYEKLLREAHELSTRDRSASDAVRVEAERVANEIDALKVKS